MDTFVDVHVPEYFVCPISLNIMRDPVTVVSGITYDRDSIERWIFKGGNAVCPVTKQPLPGDPDLTPNHTLRRLIQAWCVANGVDRIPSPKPPLSKLYVRNLTKDLDLSRPELLMKTLHKLEALAMENDRNRVFMVETGLAEALMSLVGSCHQKRLVIGLEEALNLFYLLRKEIGRSRGAVVSDEYEAIDSLMWILGYNCFDSVATKSRAAYALKIVVQKANSGVLERLNTEFFASILSKLRKFRDVSQEGMNSLLHVLLDACPWGRNRVSLVELGAVSNLIEIEYRSSGKKATEIVLGILCDLCSCADGRAELVNHRFGMEIVTRQIQKVSWRADDRAVFIIWLICKYSGTNEVVGEMLRMGTASKLCMVVQSNSDPQVKERAKEILRANCDVWKELPCMELGSL